MTENDATKLPVLQIRRQRAAILLRLDRLDRPAGFDVLADDLGHERALAPAAAAAYAALAAALESRP